MWVITAMCLFYLGYTILLGYDVNLHDKNKDENK